MDRCFICQRWAYTETHHIFGGSRRKKSDKMGLVVELCHECHNEPPNGVHQNENNRIALQQYGQRKAMEMTGWTTEDFIREFGKNYL